MLTAEPLGDEWHDSKLGGTLTRVIDKTGFDIPLEDHIKQFVANGIRINERDAYGDTVLHCIYREPPPIRCSERDIWFLILEYSKSKLPINERNDRGATPLCWALKHGHDSTPLIKDVS